MGVGPKRGKDEEKRVKEGGASSELGTDSYPGLE